MKRILHIHTSITPTSWSSMIISSPKQFQMNKGIKPYWLSRVPSYMLQPNYKNHYYAIRVLHTQKQTPRSPGYTRDTYCHQYITPVSSETDLEKYQTSTENTISEISEDDYETVNHELRVSALDYDDIFYDDYILLGQHHT